MAQKFVTNLNLNQNQLINGKFEVLASDPSTDNFEGRLIYNSTEKTIKVYTGSAWRKMLHAVTSTGSQSEALTISESNGAITIQPNLATSSDDGVMLAADKAKLDASTASETANTLVLRDGSGRFKAVTPVADLDVANKGYVDAARTGLDVKASVKVATTAAITIASGLEAGDVIDGYTLVAGDRVLVKNQTTASENGIYIASASGAASRATDADNNAEVTPGMFTFVENGTVNADSGWVLITDGDITVGTTALSFSLFSVTGNILAGDGLSKSGDVLNVNVTTGIEIHSDALRISSSTAGNGLGYSAGVLSVNVGAATGLEITSDNVGIKLNSAIAGLDTTSDGLKIKSNIAGDGITYTDGVLSRNVIDLAQGSDDTTGTLPVDQGGTGAVTTSAARDSLAVDGDTGSRTSSTPTLARKTTQVIGNSTDTSFAIVHNFNTRLLQVEVFDTATYDTVIADVVRTNVNTVTINFSVAPDNGAYTVVITG